MANIKYKSNGEYKDIVVKVGDTLPIGTEIDYEGSVVPDGWEEVNYDTGWVDLSSYVNTTNFAIRSGVPPMARKIGKQVFLKGSVYCSTAPSSNNANILTNIPSQFRPTEEIAGSGARYGSTTPFRIWYEDGNIKIQEANNIPTTQYYQGYALSSLGSYLVD